MLSVKRGQNGKLALTRMATARAVMLECACRLGRTSAIMLTK